MSAQQAVRYYLRKVTASLSAANTWTDPVPILGPFNLSISGIWAGTITLQRTFDGGATWLDVATYTANIERRCDEPELGVLYRAGFKSGEYTSGTAIVRIGQ